jgi:hypothetical protein
MRIVGQLLASLVMVLALAACARTASPPVRQPARADLVPMNRVTGQAPGPFCNVDRRTAVPKLIVSVRNQGHADAPPSTTTVSFSPGGVFQLPTPAVPAGGAVDLPPLNVPMACFNPNCEFKITVDSANTVNESNAGNNSAQGKCNG